jgi:hypothetical protein
MTTALTYPPAQDLVDDLFGDGPRHDDARAAKHNRNDARVRRVAVIRPSGSHFELVPARALTSAVTFGG